MRAAVDHDGAEAGATNVTEGLIDTFASAGTVDDVVGQLGAFADAGLDLPLAWHTLGPDPPSALDDARGSGARGSRHRLRPPAP